jgi:metal-dependent hydrolase (beta-lactamase superfamily II)
MLQLMLLAKDWSYSARKQRGTVYLSNIRTGHRCSHAGIVNVVKDAISKFDRPVYMVRLLYVLRG